MAATSRDKSAQDSKSHPHAQQAVRLHPGQAQGTPAQGSQASGQADHAPELHLVAIPSAPSRVPTRLPGRDAAGERVRARHVHPGRAENASPPSDPPVGTATASPSDDDDGDNLERLLAAKVGPQTFQRYFQGQARLERAEGGLRVVVASKFLVPIVEGRFRKHLVEIARGGSVSFIDRPEDFPAARPPKARALRPKPQEQAPKPHAAQRDRTLRLEDFVVGESNRLAHMAATSISDPNATPRAGNMLVLHGGCGLGKTHLLRGMAHNYNRLRESGSKAKYVTAEHFTNGFLAALRSGTTDRFRDQYRGVELLCLDDVHFLATKEATKAELLHTLDQILQSGCRLALASDEHPRQVEGLGKQLISRLLSGLTIELGSPELELREAMVRKLAAQRGLTMDAQVVSAIAQSAVGEVTDSEPGSFRDIEGAMARVDAFHNLLGRAGGQPAGDRVAMSTVHQALGKRTHVAPKAGPVRVEAVIESICGHLGVGRAEFAGRGRHRRVVLARALVALISRQLTTASYPEIAAAMGRPNHSSIITAVRRIERQIADEELVAVGCADDGKPIADLAASLAKRIGPRGR
jgi:chromosomal replication initiator protein